MTGTGTDPIRDLLVIGGGINGCGIARDAAGRGFSVLLAEMNDLASGTSSWSTKLVHGGLRYLEYYEFRLVREALTEREVLWANAPHIIRPLRFILPHHRGLRPRWLLRLGLFFYDHLGGRRLLPPTRTLDLRHDPAGQPLKSGYSTAFEYSDCAVDDARLVALNARDAADRGAEILTRTRVIAARRDAASDGTPLWRVVLQDTSTGSDREVRARVLVNAAGPWVDHVFADALGHNDARNVRLVQGSHLVVQKLFDHDRAYIFQNADGRIIFAIPYEKDFTLIGTTDRDFTGDPGKAEISEEETDYLIAAAADYFDRPPRRTDIVWTYSGVRPLYDDGASKAQEATRDYVLVTMGGQGAKNGSTPEAPLISVFGGKITTYRRLAESVLERIEAELGRRGAAWTRIAPLPGGDFPATGLKALKAELASAHPTLDKALLKRLAEAYGTRAKLILDGVTCPEDLGKDFGAGLSAREVSYLIDQEFARCADDVLWRRSKLGLRLGPEDAAALDEWIAARLHRTGVPH